MHVDRRSIRRPLLFGLLLISALMLLSTAGASFAVESPAEPECKSDADCGRGEVCELGGADCSTPVCVPGCHEPEQCGEGATCTRVECVTCPCPGRCEDLPPEPDCRNDADCGDGEVCELGGPDCATPVCVPGCHESAQCGEGATCTEVVCVTCPCPGLCEDLPPEPDCRNDGDCPAGEVCELGGQGCATPMCVPGCHADRQCDDGEKCIEVVCVTCPCPGLCQDVGPDPECRTDADCSAGEVCELAGPSCSTPVCVPGCHEDEQCEPNEICREVQCVTCPCPGLCTDVGPEPECRVDADCGAGEVCELGGPQCATPVCVPGCHEDEQCGDNEGCEEVLCVTCPCPGVCFDVGPDPECRTDEDCREGTVCERGGPKCSTPVCAEGCHEDQQCGPNQHCEKVYCITCPCPGICSDDNPCGDGRIPGDANGDGIVNGGDYTIWADHFGEGNVGFAKGDFNCDGRVDGADYTIWADHFGKGVPITNAAAGSAAAATTCGLGMEVSLLLLPLWWRRRRSF